MAKSSYSNGVSGCVDVKYRKASFSQGQSNCVEVAHNGDQFQVRDTKLGEDSPVLTFTREEWIAFLLGAKDGEFDHGVFDEELVTT